MHFENLKRLTRFILSFKVFSTKVANADGRWILPYTSIDILPEASLSPEDDGEKNNHFFEKTEEDSNHVKRM